MNNIDNLKKNVQEKVFCWCEENPLSAKMLGAWILSDVIGIVATLIGALDVRVWYSQGQNGFFCSGLLISLIDICFAWFLFRRLNWARNIGLVMLGCAVGGGVWAAFGMFGGLDSFFHDILTLPVLACDCAAFWFLWHERHDPELPARKTAAVDWAVLAGWILLCGIAGVVMANNQPNDAAALEYMKRAAVDGGASAKKDLVEWMMENVEGMDKATARESVDEFIRQNKGQEDGKPTSFYKERQKRNNIKGTLGAIIGLLALIGWLCKKYGEMKNQSDEGTIETSSTNGTAENSDDGTTSSAGGCAVNG